MKKLLFVSLIVLFLAACGGESEESSSEESSVSDNVAEESATEVATETEGSDSDPEEVAVGDTVENEVGTFNIVYKQKDMADTHENGPINLTITGVQVGTLKPSENFKDIFEGKEKLTTITIGMEVENTTDATVGIYPSMSTLTTNAGDQVNSDMILSGDVGGDFFGKVTKEEEVTFTLDTPPEELENGTLIIDGAHDEDYSPLGEQMKIDLKFK